MHRSDEIDGASGLGSNIGRTLLFRLTRAILRAITRDILIDIK